jgi:hypothetical protein
MKKNEKYKNYYGIKDKIKEVVF